MKKLLIVLFALALFAPSAHAQLFEAVGNPNVVAGGTYQLSAPEVGHRAAFFLSANVAGVKLGDLPVYVGGVGVALPASVESVAASFGNFVQLTVPAVTWYPNGGKALVQAGYSYILNNNAQARSGVYVAAGWAWSSPNYLAYKRSVKAAKKAAAAKQGPVPAVLPNPTDVK